MKTEQYPGIDSRRADELYQELRTIGSVALPDWHQAGGDGELGNGLLKIAARMAEHLTSRADKTPQRDMTAFYRMLDIPGDWSRPAQVPLVFSLSNNRESEVFAPAGVQVAAATDDGEVIFETQTALKLSPAKLEFLALADAAKDSIELPPPGFLELNPKDQQTPDYRVVTFVSAGATLLQIEPVEGWQKGDLARIQNQVYRVAENKDGLITLLDPLAISINAGTAVEKVQQFDAQRMRDLQEHIVYIGHKELLQLEKPATIKLAFTPATVVKSLQGSDYRWEIYATKNDEETPDWHALTSKAEDGAVELQKVWNGSVEEYEVNGEKSRWLRVVRETKISSENIPNTRTQSISLCLSTLSADQIPPAPIDPCEPLPISNDEEEEGSNSGDTISQAFYNATPLPLTTRFFPFGTEPQRFDTFALAAPEALSKPGATVTLDITLTDASFTTIALTREQSPQRPLRLYGTGRSGKLSALTFTDNDIDWEVLDSPEIEDIPSNLNELQNTEDLLLNDIFVDALQVKGLILDAIVVQDTQGNNWLRLVPHDLNINLGSRTWFFITQPNAVVLHDVRLVGQSERTDKMFMLGVSENGDIYRRGIRFFGFTPVLDSQWLLLSNGSETLELSAETKITVVNNMPPPAAENEFLSADIITVDAEGRLWFGIFNETSGQIQWYSVANSYHFELSIRPRALYLDDTVVVIFAVQSNREPIAIHFNTVDKSSTVFTSPTPPNLDSSAAIQIFPRDEGFMAGFFYTNSTGQAVIDFWAPQGPLQQLVIPAQFEPPTPSSSVFAFISDTQPVIIVGGKEETINQYRLPNATSFNLFYGLVSSSPDLATDIDFVDPTGSGEFVDLASFTEQVIEDVSGQTPVYIYQVSEIDDLLAPLDWKLFQLQQSYSGIRGSGADNRLELDPSDNLTQIGSSLHIQNEHYLVEAAPGQRTIASLDLNVPLSAVDYRVLFYWQSDNNFPQIITLDQNDEFTEANHELIIGDSLFFVLSVNSSNPNNANSKDATLVFALPNTENIPYQLDSAGPTYIGKRITYDAIELDSNDLDTIQGSELILDNRNFVVNDINGRNINLMLALPREETFNYQVIGDNTTFTATRTASNKAIKDSNDNVSAIDSVWMVGDLLFSVLHLDNSNPASIEADLSAGIPEINAQPPVYDNTQLSTFSGQRREANEVELDNNDTHSAVGTAVQLLPSNAVANISALATIRTVSLVDNNGDNKDIPGNDDSIDYDLIDAIQPHPTAFTVSSKLLYRLDWSPNFNSALEQLRYVPPGDPDGEIIQRVEYSERADSNTLNWVLVSAATGANEDVGSVELLNANTERWQSETLRNFQNPDLSWEYFDGKTWRSLERRFNDGTAFFSKSGKLTFEVPEDLSATEISGKEDFWIRARLIGGDYGRPIYRVETSTRGNSSTQEINVDTSHLNPPEIIHIEASFNLETKVPPEFVMVKNNLDFRRQTQANIEPGAEYELFEGTQKINQREGSHSLYFGFNKPFNVSPLSLYVDAEDQEQETELIFEVLAADNTWLRLTAKDETLGLHQRGFILLSVNSEPRRARRFGEELFWLRASPKNPTGNWAPRLRGIFVNAGRAQQARTFRQEILGSSIGEPGLRLNFANKPVLPNSLELRVRENISEDMREALNAQDGLNTSTTNSTNSNSTIANSATGNSKKVTQYDALSLPGDWVRWQRVDSFIGRGADERIFKLNSATGTLTFGDGRQGRIPPAGTDNIRAITYQTGGGLQGNLAAYQITDAKTSVEALESVANPIAAAGGTAIAPLPDQLKGAPANLRRSQQALTPPDIEALVVASSPELIRAKCFYPAGPKDPITVVIAQRTGERCPLPSLAVRSQLEALIRSQAWGGLGDRDLKVINPTYVKVQLSLRVKVTDLAQAASLEQAASERLRHFLHPIEGGPIEGGARFSNPFDNRPGWPFGRTLYRSDIYRALATVPYLDRVISIDLLAARDGYDLAELPATALICADEKDISLSVEFSEEECMR